MTCVSEHGTNPQNGRTSWENVSVTTRPQFLRRGQRQRSAAVVGSGPNGLSAAIVLAQHGYRVDVFEEQDSPGGAVRSMSLIQSDVRHDFGSAIYPLALSSPFFRSLPLESYGLNWIQPPAALAHPFDDGTAVVLEKSMPATVAALGIDGRAWQKLLESFVTQWESFTEEILQPVVHLPRHPLLLANFGWKGLLSGRSVSTTFFREPRTQAFFAGLAAHSTVSLDTPLSGAFGLVLAAAAHSVGWPVAKGGAQSITDALCSHLQTLGVSVRTSTRIETLDALADYDEIFCDVSPRQLHAMAGDLLTSSYKHRLTQFAPAVGVFKVDYLLSCPIPWKAQECLRAATVHLGSSLEEICASESVVAQGNHSETPFVILTQPSLFDESRAPQGRHTAWAYCHVPNGSVRDMLPAIERQIERFAPGFRECVLGRHIFSPSALERMDSNLIGGDISGGAVTPLQVLFRPTVQQYRTSNPRVFLCSASTPPGGGVHGMCGYHAAQAALSLLS